MPEYKDGGLSNARCRNLRLGARVKTTSARKAMEVRRGGCIARMQFGRSLNCTLRPLTRLIWRHLCSLCGLRLRKHERREAMQEAISKAIG
jgi:hypothetical protein